MGDSFVEGYSRGKPPVAQEFSIITDNRVPRQSDEVRITAIREIRYRMVGFQNLYVMPPVLIFFRVYRKFSKGRCP